MIAVADDPGAHYSSNEQDSRIACAWAGVPCFEPATQQDSLELTCAAFALSEAVELPVVVRSVTRLSHASGVIELGEAQKPASEVGFNKHWEIPFRWNVYGPPGLVEKHTWQLDQVKKAGAWISQSAFNPLQLTEARAGLVGVGIGASYTQEAVQELGIRDRVNTWKVTTPFPLPEASARQVLTACDRVLVVEEGAPLVETQLRSLAQELSLPVRIFGKAFSSPFNQVGELTTDGVFQAVADIVGLSQKASAPMPEVPDAATWQEVASLAIPRSSSLCAGCPHLGTYWAIEKALPQGAGVVPIINGDIGCYEQAGYGIKGQIPKASSQISRRNKPTSVYTTLDTLYVMGSGLAMAQGEACAGYQNGPIVAVAGDSTFFHATLPALANAVWNQTKLTFVILDNSRTAMTGHQPSPASERRQQGHCISIESVVRGLGVPFLRVVDAFQIQAVSQAVREALEFDGVAVVISRGECALQSLRDKDTPGRMRVNPDLCDGCKRCIILGCPAVVYASRRADIDPALCVGCGICLQACPSDAIYEEG